MRQYSLEALLPAYQTQEIRDLTLSSDSGIDTSQGGVGACSFPNSKLRVHHPLEEPKFSRIIRERQDLRCSTLLGQVASEFNPTQKRI